MARGKKTLRSWWVMFDVNDVVLPYKLPVCVDALDAAGAIAVALVVFGEPAVSCREILHPAAPHANPPAERVTTCLAPNLCKKDIRGCALSASGEAPCRNRKKKRLIAATTIKDLEDDLPF